MNGIKNSKKISTLAATVAVATAFCGLCAGVATSVNAEAAPTNVQTSAAESYKVILNPGWNFEGGTRKLNTITDAGVTKLTDDEANKVYFADNAYFCNVAVGENLPKPTAGRSGLTFLGWRYSKDGELVTVEKMPAATDGNVFLYADWQAEGVSQGGGGGGGDDPVTPTPTDKVVTVNGKTMNKNPSPMAGVDEEYMLSGVTLEAGALTFNVDGSKITISTLDGSSTGLSLSSGTVTVDKAGKFDLYLKLKGKTWEIYGARDASQDVTSIVGETATATNIYLAGNVTDANFSWNNWNSTNGYKGLKVTGNTITVHLGKGDNCKFVKYVDNTNNNNVWQEELKDTANSGIKFAGSNSNMEIQTSGTYMFEITEKTKTNGKYLGVEVTAFTAD